MRDAGAMTRPNRPRDWEARERIVEALDRNLLVEAGAGSGKTESLARRMAAGLAAGVYEVEGMAAVTFTRKAAAELRGRVQLELERAVQSERDDARRGRIALALSRLERLFAGTIHAFCAHLIRERPVEAGVAPGFTEVDEIDDEEFRARAWRDFLDRERARGSAVLAELQKTGIGPGDLDDAFRTICTFADVTFPPGTAPAPDSAPAWEAIQRFWEALQSMLPEPIPAETTCKVQRAARDFRGRLRVVGGIPRPAVVGELLEQWEKPPEVTQKWWAETAKERKAAKGRIDRLLGEFCATTVEPFLTAWRQYRYRLAVTLLAAARDFAADARRRALVLNYGDLLQVAARLLRDNLDVRAALQRKYRWLFVDEFQDTSASQAEVILLLAAQPGSERDWTRVSPRPGVLFVVGDPKQSIYRFTGADISTYNRVRSIFEASGEVVTLTTSFRADPTLCEWANEVFAAPGFFPSTPTVEQAAFHGLHTYRDEGDARTTGLRTLTTPAGMKAAKAVAAADAAAIARFIHAEVAAGRRRWGDFLILTRKKVNLPRYTAALDELRIPATVSGSVAFTKSREVTNLAALLRALADPDDGVALVGVLRGPLFGVSDEALFAHREAGFSFVLTAPLPDDAAGPVADALRALQAMYRSTRILPVAAAVDRILETTGLLARAVAATPGGAEAGDLLHALDRVRQIAERGGTLSAAASAIEQDLDGAEVESVPLEPGRQDVVRVMNLHKAKGLEALVVFLADPLGGVRNSCVSVRVVRGEGPPVGYLSIGRSRGAWGWDVLALPEGWPEHEAAEMKFVMAEETRLLYVATTRARELLVVSRCAETGGSTRPWEALASWLGQAEELRDPGPPVLRLPSLGDISEEGRSRGAADREKAHERAARASWQVESVTATAHRGAAYGHPLAEGRTREPDSGMAWGTLIHGLLEWTMRGPHRDRAHLERLAGWLTSGNPELRRFVPEAVDTVERVMASEFWQCALAAGERLVEVPFAVKADDGPDGARLLYGVIDLAFRGTQGWELIDHKTDQADVATLSVRYGDQVRAYARQWAELTTGGVAFAGLHAVRAAEVSANLLSEPTGHRTP